MKDGKVVSEIELSYVATVGGAFGVGFSNKEFLSVSHVKEGEYVIKLNKNGTYQTATVQLEELENTLKVSLYKDGSIAVSVNGGESVVLGTVETTSLNVTLLNFNAFGTVNVLSVSATNRTAVVSAS